MSGPCHEHAAEQILRNNLDRLRSSTDRMFAGLMALQFAAGVVIAMLVSPRTWSGVESSVHAHVVAAVVIGVVVASAPIILAMRMPGKPLTRYVIATAQMLFSALLIHLTGGRIETHFHVFGSLAFLAFYRDWRVLVPATLVVGTDHLVRGLFWPESVFGLVAPAPWRALEHVGWVVFENAFLVYSCRHGLEEMRVAAQREAELSTVNEQVAGRVEERTGQLRQRQAELEAEMVERKRLEGQLVQAQKLESIGQLAAGIAHEINTPTQFISDNVRFLRDNFDSMLRVIDGYASQLDPDAPPRMWDERVEEIRSVLETLDYEFLQTEIPQAIDQSLDGLERVTTIVRAMKDFSHPARTDKEPADINRAVESTTTVCRSRWKYAADLELDLDQGLPEVHCLAAEINQVILNLVVNAADAIGECVKEGSVEKGLIRVTTRRAGESVEIRVLDNGPGIPPEIKNRIFDPFFTTKDVGIGTGQGLSICRDVVVLKHAGTIECASTPGQGTEFVVTLPLESEPAAARCAA